MTRAMLSPIESDVRRIGPRRGLLVTAERQARAQSVIFVTTDRPLRSELRSAFEDRRIGFQSVDGPLALQDRLAQLAFDAIIIDGALTSFDAFDLCRQAAGRSRAPLILLTRHEDSVERMLALELGADYVAWRSAPSAELIAQVRSALRRSSRLSSGTTVWRFAEWCFEVERRKLTAPDGSVGWLSLNNARLLSAFLEDAGQCLTRREIATRMAAKGEPNALLSDWGVRVHRLRQALHKLQPDSELLVTMNGKGYLFDAEVCAVSGAAL